MQIPFRSLCWTCRRVTWERWHGWADSTTAAKQLVNSHRVLWVEIFYAQINEKQDWTFFVCQASVLRAWSNAASCNTNNLIKNLEKFHAKDHQDFLLTNSQTDMKQQQVVTVVELQWFCCFCIFAAAALPDRHTLFCLPQRRCSQFTEGILHDVVIYFTVLGFQFQILDLKPY